jgi:hypothetical protein
MIISKIKGISLNIKKLWSAKPLFAAAIVFFTVFSIYAIIYIPSDGISVIDDHFFHFRYASLLRDKGWEVVENFPWVHFSRTVTEHARFNVSLFHFALIPFTFIKNPILGLKISDIFWASLACSAFYYLLRKIRIKWALFYVFVLLSFPFFVNRILMGRAFVITPVLVFLELFLAIRKKYRLLFLLALFHAFWHQATYPFPLAIIGLVEISRYIIKQKFILKNIFAAALGTVAGMAFLPDFPANINVWGWTRYLVGLSSDIANGAGISAVEGTELSSASLLSFWLRSDMAILMLIISVALFVYYYLKDKGASENQEADRLTTWKIYTYPTFLFTFFSFSFSILFSGRFLDYYFVGTVFLLALVVQRVLEEEGKVVNSRIKNYVFSGIIIFFFVAFLNSFISLKSNIGQNDYTGIKNSAEWIGEKSSEGEVVFLFDWDNFPIAFFHNQKNTYTMGIEPGLLTYNQDLYWKWHNIFLYNYYCGLPKDCAEEKGNILESIGDNEEEMNEFNKKNSEKIINSIKKDFNSRFIISNSWSFDYLLKQNPDLIKDSFSYVSKSTRVTASAFELK